MKLRFFKNTFKDFTYFKNPAITPQEDVKENQVNLLHHTYSENHTSQNNPFTPYLILAQPS